MAFRHINSSMHACIRFCFKSSMNCIYSALEFTFVSENQCTYRTYISVGCIKNSLIALVFLSKLKLTDCFEIQFWLGSFGSTRKLVWNWVSKNTVKNNKNRIYQRMSAIKLKWPIIYAPLHVTAIGKQAQEVVIISPHPQLLFSILSCCNLKRDYVCSAPPLPLDGQNPINYDIQINPGPCSLVRLGFVVPLTNDKT